MNYWNYGISSFIGAYFGFAIFLLIVIFIINILFARTFAGFAEEKGYSRSKYFWLCAIVPPIGIAMVIAMPDKTMIKKLDELNETCKKLGTVSVQHHCKYCGAELRKGAKFCNKCGKQVD